MSLKRSAAGTPGLVEHLLWPLVEVFTWEPELLAQESLKLKDRKHTFSKWVFRSGGMQGGGGGGGGVLFSFFDLFIPGSVSINFYRSQAWDGIPVQVIYLGILAREACRRVKK